MGKVALLSNIDIKTYLNNIYLLSYDTAINMHLFSYVINENEAPNRLLFLKEARFNIKLFFYSNINSISLSLKIEMTSKYTKNNSSHFEALLCILK